MPKHIVAAIALAAVSLLAAAPQKSPTREAESLAAAFHNPPDSARPWVFWFWIDGNVTHEGITADLEAMRRAGIGGVSIMEVDVFVPKGPVRFLSPKWHEMFQYMLKEAARLGIEVDMNNDGGWNGSGGPWNRPELAMQMTVWSETRAAGPHRFDAVLPQPKTNEGFYRDIAVLAFPTPAPEASRMADAGPRFTWGAERKPLDAARLADGNAATAEDLPAPEAGAPHTIDIEFPRPFSASALTLSLDQYRARARGTLAVSGDGRVYRTVREFDALWPVATANFEPVSSRYFRVTLAQEGRAGALRLGELELLGGSRIEGITGKALYSYVPFLPDGMEPKVSGAAIERERIVDLTARMDGSGRLKWDVPPGNWTVLRIGYTPTGQVNHPAPREGTGLECDKLSKAAVEAHFAGMMSTLIADQQAAGVNAMRSVHIDSWEAGSQNWTPLMREEFRNRRGYDLLSYLPTLTGRIVGSGEISERFLWDLRSTIAGMVNDNYAGHMRELGRRNGLQLSMEPYGAGPLDDLAYAGNADLSLTEFWMGMEPWWSSKALASAARTYGHSVFGAEAFTSRSPAGRWQNHPFRMKPLGDRMFTAGVNRFVFHRFAMQPWLNRFPGMTMGPYGIEFDRTVTWWEQSKAYLEYVARCQHLLQQGRFAADVAYLAPEKVMYDFQAPSPLSPEIPPGYEYDVVPAGLLSQMTVRDGRLALPAGLSYRVLVLPASNTMRVAQLRKVAELVRAGATVVGPPPAKSPSLAEYGEGDAEVRRLAAELWGECDGTNLTVNRSGKGQVIWGRPLAAILNDLGAPPDFTSLGVETGAHVRYIHRTAGEKEIYFIASAESQAATFLCTFRAGGKQPELWWPDSGRIQRAGVYEQNSSGTRIPIRLEPYGSVFVVFEKGGGAAPEPLVSVTRNGVEASGIRATSVSDLRGKMQDFTVEPDDRGRYRIETAQPGTWEAKTASGRRISVSVPRVPDPIEIAGPWQVTFPAGWGAPPHAEFDRLMSWTGHPDSGVKYFSGTATYRRTISIPAAMLGGSRALYLDLGRVEVIAEVRLNGRDLGILWKPPFRVEITDAARAGENDLEVKVVNSWANRLIGDEQLPEDAEWEGPRMNAWPQWLLEGRPSPTGRVTFTTWKHWDKDSALLESGLLGPVRIECAERMLLQ